MNHRTNNNVAKSEIIAQKARKRAKRGSPSIRPSDIQELCDLEAKLDAFRVYYRIKAFSYSILLVLVKEWELRGSGLTCYGVQRDIKRSGVMAFRIRRCFEFLCSKGLIEVCGSNGRRDILYAPTGECIKAFNGLIRVVNASLGNAKI